VFRSANKKGSPATRQAQYACKFKACPVKTWAYNASLSRVAEDPLASTAQLK